jgi:HAD superfamily hydrolase (TIGR01509 family)
MTIKAVVFDLDGTIVKFNLDYKAARAEVIEHLTAKGFPRSLFSLDESAFEMLKKAEITMKNNGKKQTEFLNLKEEVFRILEKYEMQSAQTTELIPGILETLKALQKIELKLAIFTVNSKKSTDYMLKAFRLKPYFKAVVTRDSVKMIKPNPIHLETVLRKLKTKPQETLVVGDSIMDIKGAQQLNAIAAAATYGMTSKEKLTQAGAKHFITTPTDIQKIIEKTNIDTVKDNQKKRLTP